MTYQDALDHALSFRIQARNESEPARRKALLRLAGQWEAWAEHCRACAAKGKALDPASRPAVEALDSV